MPRPGRFASFLIRNFTPSVHLSHLSLPRLTRGGGGVNTSGGFSCNRIKYYWVGLDILIVAKCGRPPLALRSAYCAGLWVENLGSRPGRVNVLCSEAKHFTLTAPLSTQEYEWVAAKCQGSLMKPCGIQTRGE